MRRKELLRLGPKRRDTLGSVKQIDRKTVCLVVVLHVAKHVVVDVTEELNLGFNAPVVAGVLEGWVLVEHATVPATHLVVGQLFAVLDALLLQHRRRLFDDIIVDPFGHIPVFLWYQLYKSCQTTIPNRFTLCISMTYRSST